MERYRIVSSSRLWIILPGDAALWSCRLTRRPGELWRPSRELRRSKFQSKYTTNRNHRIYCPKGTCYRCFLGCGSTFSRFVALCDFTYTNIPLTFMSIGFLDGGDRAMLLDSRSNMPSPVPFEKRQFGSTSDSSDSSEGHDADPASLTTSFMPTSSLLVTNLPTLLFSQVQDLHPLFFPFGPIDKLEIVQVSPMGTMSVLVQYSRASVAQEARDNLSGQVYGTHQIEARFVRLTTLALPGFERNSPANDMISVDNFTRHTSVGSFAPGSLTRTSSFNQERVNGGPFIVKVSPLLNSFGFPNLGISDDASMNHSRQSSFSAKQSPFSNVFDDHRDPAQMSAHLG